MWHNVLSWTKKIWLIKKWIYEWRNVFTITSTNGNVHVLHIVLPIKVLASNITHTSVQSNGSNLVAWVHQSVYPNKIFPRELTKRDRQNDRRMCAIVFSLGREFILVERETCKVAEVGPFSESVEACAHSVPASLNPSRRSESDLWPEGNGHFCKVTR